MVYGNHYGSDIMLEKSPFIYLSNSLCSVIRCWPISKTYHCNKRLQKHETNT